MSGKNHKKSGAWFPRRSLSGVPVLLYHGVRGKEETVDAHEKKYWLSLERFQAHLATIRTAGLQVGLLRELNQESASSPVPQAVLTFDDGRASDYQLVFPALQAASLRAEFFINTAMLNRAGYLTWQEVREMHRAGMSIQSHGHEHVDLSRLSQRQLREQLVRSKHLLEDRLGGEVTALSIPYGLLNPRVLVAARGIGFQQVCCSRYWPAARGAWLVNRATIYAGTTTTHLQRILAKDPLWYWRQKLRSGFLYLPRRLALAYWPAHFGVRSLQEQQ